MVNASWHRMFWKQRVQSTDVKLACICELQCFVILQLAVPQLRATGLASSFLPPCTCMCAPLTVKHGAVTAKLVHHTACSDRQR